MPIATPISAAESTSTNASWMYLTPTTNDYVRANEQCEAIASHSHSHKHAATKANSSQYANFLPLFLYVRNHRCCAGPGNATSATTRRKHPRPKIEATDAA